MKKEIMEWIKMLAISLTISMVIICFARPTVVSGLSMTPTLDHYDILVINQLYYKIQEPELGDIVAFHSDLPMPDAEEGEKMDLIKRVIGVAGDEILIQDGIVSVNGEILEEGYLLETEVTGPDLHLIVPEGKLFVMGDNRNGSKDSRNPSVGTVDENEILGKAYFRLFPFTKLGGLQ